jgi:hypothetical protein
MPNSRQHGTSAFPPMQKLAFTRKEAAARLSLCIRTLDYCIAAKLIRVTRKGACVRIAWSEIVRFSRIDHPSRIRPTSAPPKSFHAGS